MKKQSRIFENLMELCSVPSISETPGELKMADKILELLRRIPYFRLHPEAARLVPIPEDPWHRSFVCALLRGGGNRAKTVVLLSHFDVVGVEGYGAQRGLAFDSAAYTQFLKNTPAFPLPADAKADLASGDYLFGRGIMDMKFGIAADLEVLARAESRLDSLEGNLLFVSVPDEEASSRGMLAAVELLLSLKEKQGLDYTCCIVSEPFFPKYPGDEKKYIYTGTIGKVLPAFYCVGRETHACEPFSGLNPNLLVAKIIEKIDSNPELCDSADGVTTPPPVCLKASDFKTSYSVQTPLASFAYFNFMTVSKTPGEVMQCMLKTARDSFREVLSDRAEKASRFTACGGRPNLPAIEPTVVTYPELYRWSEKAGGEKFTRHIRDFIRTNLSGGNAAPDLRSLSIEVVREVYRYCPCQKPTIVVFFCPPFYPHSDICRPNDLVLRLSRFLKDRAARNYDEKLSVEPVFPGLSDMSYLGLPRSFHADEMTGLFPLWGSGYRLPLDTMSRLNIPFINIGPWGKDAHKSTERLCLSFSLEKSAPILQDAVEWLLTPNHG